MIVINADLSGACLEEKILFQAIIQPQIDELMTDLGKSLVKREVVTKEVKLCSKNCRDCAFDEVCIESDVLKGVY